MEKTKAIKEAYLKAQKEVKNIVVNEIKDLVAGSTGFLILGETPEEEFGVAANGETYCEVRLLITGPDGDTWLATDNGLVGFGDISTDEAVELHDLIFDRLMPRITEEVIDTMLDEMFGGCEECSSCPEIPCSPEDDPFGLLTGLCLN